MKFRLTIHAVAVAGLGLAAILTGRCERFRPGHELRSSGHQLRYRSRPIPGCGIQTDAPYGGWTPRSERRMASLF